MNILENRGLAYLQILREPYELLLITIMTFKIYYHLQFIKSPTLGFP